MCVQMSEACVLSLRVDYTQLDLCVLQLPAMPDFTQRKRVAVLTTDCR